jgi:hypothetical protein
MPQVWVKEYFKHHLVDAAEGYTKSNDRGKEPERTKLIQQVAESIRETARDENEEGTLPIDLPKVIIHLYNDLCTDR